MQENKIKKEKRTLRLFFTGMGMGVADLVPGVSGGTIAFLMGIYRELIFSIKKVTGPVLKLFVRFKWKEALRETPLGFLLPVFGGIIFAVFSLANILSYLLGVHPVFVWSFFFGIILASVPVIARRNSEWSVWRYFLFAASAGAAYFLTGLVPLETPATALLFFLSGAVAISAMILPGISGAFILIILGKYEQILNAVVDREMLTIAIFIAGIITGLALFSRVLSWWFSNYYNAAIVILSGIILGSLRRIWPWKEGEVNVFPEAFSAETLTALAFFVLGFILVIYVSKFGNSKSA